ncbi:class I SAM-dependent methyltransferase [Francisellaceae bacterium]|nr:class I SAM-dependent methyltransferase [Francisellaceae bacterium]
MENVFSRQKEDYKKARPAYPNEFFAALSKLCENKNLAWDSATGNGQAAVSLSEHFNQVIATDISQTQINHATYRSNVDYRVEAVEQNSLLPNSVDMINAAQAIHWLNLDDFYNTIYRVAKRGALVAIYGFREVSVSSKIDQLIDIYIQEIVGSDWREGKDYYDSEYQSLSFPFKEIKLPPFSIKLNWTLDQVLGLLDSYSGPQNYLDRVGQLPSSEIRADMLKLWGDQQKREVVIPIVHRIGYT